jgi:hypothetical protein
MPMFAVATVKSAMALTAARADDVVQIDKSAQRMAIRGINELACPGRLASHGLHQPPPFAAVLFASVKHNGPRNTRIELSHWPIASSDGPRLQKA